MQKLAMIPQTRTSGAAARWPWIVAAAAFLTLVGAAGFRSVPGVLMDSLLAGSLCLAAAVMSIMVGRRRPAMQNAYASAG